MTHEMALSIIKQETQEQTADRIVELYQVISEYAEQRYRLREALGKLRRKHYLCGDSYYSCPKVGLDHEGESCTNEYADYECDCGADEYNAIIDVALQEARDE